MKTLIYVCAFFGILTAIGIYRATHIKTYEKYRISKKIYSDGKEAHFGWLIDRLHAKHFFFPTWFTIAVAKSAEEAQLILNKVLEEERRDRKLTVAKKKG